MLNRRPEIFSALAITIGVMLIGFLLWRKPTPSEPEQAAKIAKVNQQDLSPNETTLPAVRDTLPKVAVADQKKYNEIPIVDRNDPSISSVLASLERGFLASLEVSAVGKRMSPDELSAHAKMLATFRLSQTMYEATIAEVMESEGKHVRLSIPAYQSAGEELQAKIFGMLPDAYKDDGMRKRITKQFGYFGQFPQAVTIAADTVNAGGEKLYRIEHETSVPNGVSRSRSTLSAIQLGSYAPFAPWLPKS